MLAYGEIKETFLPRMCKARVEAKSNTKSACVEYQPWNPSVLHFFTFSVRGKINYWERNKTTTKNPT